MMHGDGRLQLGLFDWWRKHLDQLPHSFQLTSDIGFISDTVAKLTKKQHSPREDGFHSSSDIFMNFSEEKIMIIRKQMMDSSLNLSIPPKLSGPESTQLCQDLGSRQTLKCFSSISLDTMMKIIMASKPSNCILDPIPTELLKELIPVLGPPMLNIINVSLSTECEPNSLKVAVIKNSLEKAKP